MAKRFTDSNKYRKPFIRGLQGAYKLLWDYLYHDCDHAGVWIVDFEIAQVYLGVDIKINKNDALKYFNDGETRIIEIDNGKKWFIVPFVSFQYGVLNEQNRAHNSVIQILKKYNLWDGANKGLTTPLLGCKDMVKDKDKDMDMVKKEELKAKFQIFYDSYPGTKRGLEIEYLNFKKHKDWLAIIDILNEKLYSQIYSREEKRNLGGFVPEWRNLQKWIEQRCWEEEIVINNLSNEKSRKSEESGATGAQITGVINKKF